MFSTLIQFWHALFAALASGLIDAAAFIAAVGTIAAGPLLICYFAVGLIQRR